MDEEAGEIRPAAAFELETEPTPARGRKQTGWWRPPSGVTGGAAGVALVLLLLSGVATSRSGGEGAGPVGRERWRPGSRPRVTDASVADPRVPRTVTNPDINPVVVAAAETKTSVEPLDADTERWQMLLPAIQADHKVFGTPRAGRMRGPDQRLGFVCHRRAIPRADTTPLSLIGFEPVTTRPEATHHITAFGCDASIEQSTPETSFGTPCAVWAFTMNKKRKKAPCRVMLYAYDKGAKGFRTPEGTAVKVGKGTGITHVMYQVHYLVPMDEQVPVKPWTDSSGIVFDIARGAAHAARPKSLGIMAAMHTSMRLKTGHKKLPFSYTVGPFGDRLAPDFEAGGGEVTLVAAHLHGHNMLKRYETGFVRGGVGGDGKGEERGRREPFGVIPQYRGYGPDQSFHPLPLGTKDADTQVTMGPSDVMYITCTFDTSDAGGSKVDYGVAHGAEMCGQIVYYHPFVADTDPERNALIRPEPGDTEVKDNDLYNVFFNDTDIDEECTEGDSS